MTDIGVFPKGGATARLVGMLLLEQSDEWETERRYFSQESMRRLLAPNEVGAVLPKGGPSAAADACHVAAYAKARPASGPSVDEVTYQ